MFCLLPLTDDVPVQSRPYATAALALACALAFALQCSLGEHARDDLVSGWGLTPMFLVHDPTLHELLTLVTSLFLHVSFAQVAANVLLLSLFGPACERALGPLRFVLFCLACGVVAGLVETLADPGNMFPVVGATGAVVGVVGLWLRQLPDRCRWSVLARS